MNKKLSFLYITIGIISLSCACNSQHTIDDSIDLWPAGNHKGQKFGYINKKGKMVIPAKFEGVYPFREGLAQIYDTKGRTCFINKQGKIVFIVPEDEECDAYFYNGYLRFKRNDCYGMYDKNFTIAIPARYDELGYMSKEGFVLFRGNKGCGYLTKDGDTTLFQSYEDYDKKTFCWYVSDFFNGRAIVETARGYGAINVAGELVFEPIYGGLRQLGGGMLAYRLHTDEWEPDAKWGLMDINGNVITEPLWGDVGVFGDNGLLPVTYEEPVVEQLGDREWKSYDGCIWGYVNRKGEQKIGMKFNGMCEPFCEGVAWVMIEDRFAIIDSSGDPLWFLENENPSTNSNNGLIRIYDYKNQIEKYVDHDKNVIYSWERVSYIPYLKPNKSSLSMQQESKKQMLRMYEGTEIYPLMEQLYKHESNLQK